jgi:uncharacterized protein YgiM (DUF1202 family)
MAQDGGDDPATILNLAATAETFACVHYYSAIQSASALGLTEQEVSQLRAFLDAELQHKLFLESNGAVPVATEFYVPGTLFSDRNVFVQTTNTAENWFVAAYLAATRRFAELGEPLLAATTAQVSGVEAEHQALIRRMGGLQPSFQTLKEPLFWNTSEVVPLFTPFLDGSGEGFVGPAAYPGDDAIIATIAGQGVEAVTPFISLNGAGTLNGAPAPAAATAGCTVSGTNANVRSGPNTTSQVVGSLRNSTPNNVIGQTTDAAGFTWYQIDAGWVRADVVTVGGDCTAVPMVSM